MNKVNGKLVAACLALAVAYAAGFLALWQIRLTWTPPTETASKLLVAAVFLILSLIFAVLVPHLRAAAEKFGSMVIYLTAIAVYAVAVASPALGIGDIYHYTIMARGWLIHGLAPYSFAPADLANDPLFNYIKPSLHGEPSIYGPLWVAISAVPVALARSTGAQIVLMKLLSVLPYAGAGMLLARQLRDRLPQAPFLAMWLLNPLAVFEIGNNGHNEGFLVLLLAVFAVGLARNSPRLALPALAAAAAAVKYWPIILAPALLGIRGAGRRSWLEGFALSAAAVALPFAVLGIGPLKPLAPVIAHQTQISPHDFSPAFAAVWELLSILGWSADGAFAAAQGAGAAALIMIMTAAGWAVVTKRFSSVSACGLIIAAFLLFSVSWLQPWYLLSVLPFLFALPAHRCRLPTLLALNAVAFLSYPYPWHLTVPALLLSVAVALSARHQLSRALAAPGISAKPRGMRQ